MKHMTKVEMFNKALQLGLVRSNEKPSDYTYRALQAILGLIK